MVSVFDRLFMRECNFDLKTKPFFSILIEFGWKINQKSLLSKYLYINDIRYVNYYALHESSVASHFKLKS